MEVGVGGGRGDQDQDQEAGRAAGIDGGDPDLGAEIGGEGPAAETDGRGPGLVAMIGGLAAEIEGLPGGTGGGTNTCIHCICLSYLFYLSSQCWQLLLWSPINLVPRPYPALFP